MPLQTSGAISLANIQSEFGGSNPIGLNEYYGADTGIPSSGSIDFADFYGKSSGPTVNRYGTYNLVNHVNGLTIPELNTVGAAMADDETGGPMVGANRGSQTGSDIIIPNQTGNHFYKFVALGNLTVIKVTHTYLIFEPLNGAPKPLLHTGDQAMGVVTGTPHAQQPLSTRGVAPFTTSGNDWISINGGAYFGYSPLWFWQDDPTILGFFLGFSAGPSTFTFNPSYTPLT